MDIILTKKILKIWYDNNRKLYEIKLKNNKKLNTTKKNITFYNKLNDKFKKFEAFKPQILNFKVPW